MDTDLADAIAEVDALRKRGDLLLAFDRAQEHLKTWPDSEKLKHLALLALARAGATRHARELFARWGMAASNDSDVLALEGRLAKDAALRLTGAARQEGLRRAAESYLKVHAREQRYYTAINAASLLFLAGDRANAEALARDVLDDTAIVAADAYWALATRAEAHLLLGDFDAVVVDLKAAAALDPSAGDVSTTRRQMKLILGEMGHGPDAIALILAPIAPPLTLHYSSSNLPGASWVSPPGEAAVDEMRARVRAVLARQQPGSVFGSIGTPAEIIFAEEVLASGAQLDLVIQVQPEALRNIVLAAGVDWAERFDACCRKAAHIHLPTDDPDATDASHTAFAVRVAMGLTLLRAQHIDSNVLQIVLHDTASGEAPGLAAASEWPQGDRRREILPLHDLVGASTTDTDAPRPTRALIFGDVLGFSKLGEQQLPLFWDTVMAAVGSVLERHEAKVQLRNTWGDAIHLVVADVGSAARICLDMQAQLHLIDGSQFAHGTAPLMRIGAHFGPVFKGWDPVVREPTFYGRALSKAARIEPVTPPGNVYVTEAFAAILLLETGQEFSCSYVGVVPLAKGFGEFRMYDLMAN